MTPAFSGGTPNVRQFPGQEIALCREISFPPLPFCSQGNRGGNRRLIVVGHKGEWQMCRTADAGPYASSNVRIDRMEVNASEGQATKRRLRLERQASPYEGASAPSALDHHK